MRQRPYRTLREVNVWQRGLNLVRAAQGSRAAVGALRGPRIQRRATSGATARVNPSGAAQANLDVLARLSGGGELAPHAGPPIGHAKPPQRCGAAGEVHLSISSRLVTTARDPTAKGLTFASHASLGPATRRNFRAWQRGAEFAKAAVQNKGSLWRRLLLGKLFSRKAEAGGVPSLPTVAAGHGLAGLRIALRNAARRKGLGSARPTAPASPLPASGWGHLQRQLKAPSTLAEAKSFRDARWRQLGLGLLSKVFRRNLEKSAQPPYRPAGALPSTKLPGAAKDEKLK
jgi:hypothetical protein